MLLLWGMLFPSISTGCEPVIVVANSVDSELNSDAADLLAQDHLLCVHPSAFDEYKTSGCIIIVGGNEAPEGTGDIVKSVITDDEALTISQGDMLVKLNVWKPGQVVVIIAGEDREKTREVFRETATKVAALFEGIETVLTTPEHGQSVIFLWPVPLSTSDKIAPYAPAAFSSDVVELPSLDPYHLREDVWFFFIDDAPYAKYVHPTRFFFYGIETRHHTLYHEEWWPVLNGDPLWVEPDHYGDKTYWVHNPGHENPHSYTPFVVKSMFDSVSRYSTARALIINGWSTGEPLQDMAEDQSSMKEALTKTGMDVESVGTVTGARQVLQQWAAEMDPYDTLVVYITAHGGRGYISVGSHIFRISELVLLLDRFERGVHIHVIIDASYAGSVIDPLKKVAELVITAVNEVTPAYGDLDPDRDINRDDRGSEFTSGLSACIKELARSESRITQWKTRAAEADESWYIFLLAEAFKTARELDAAAVMEYTTPVLWIYEPDILEEKPQKQQQDSGCPCQGK